ncbi:hypothetical protein FGIG_10303 [Fasciola gigantica]|uniref:LIM zinc-binding domain-containing protein n=1 Tax=Fasciola gigantica TaxID=46835 RepID=A0A504Y925_FASGI|nr:hypothetical protein FGIG_10303 [Fasciola gigantica]
MGLYLTKAPTSIPNSLNQSEHGCITKAQMSLPLKSSGHHCFACREPVEESNCLRVVDRLCHASCFKCQTCRQNLNSNMFGVALGDLYCEKHYADCLSAHDHSGRSYGGSHPSSHGRATCFICGLPVEEPEPLNGPHGIFHGGCFRCNLCRRMVNVDRYKVIKGKLRCDPDCEEQRNGYDRPTNNANLHPQNGYLGHQNTYRDLSRSITPRSPTVETCFNCSLPVKSKDRLFVMERVYHRDCFRCRRCDIVLSPEKYNVDNEKPCCQPNCIDQIEQRSIKIPITLESHSCPYIYTERNTPIRSHSALVGSKLSDADGVRIFRGDVDKIAKIQRRLEQIQAAEAEEVKCYSCGRRVYPAERLHILNRIYHPDCLKCETCGRVLNGRRYSVHEGKTYCVAHHRELLNLKNFVGKSGSSPFGNQANVDTTMNRSAASTPYHDSNVLAVSKEAEKSMETEFVPNSDPPLLRRSYSLHFVAEIFEEAKSEEPKCFECGIKVYPAEQLSILNRIYHRTCFKCKTCQNVLDLGRYGVCEGVPYCNAHHRQALNLGSLSSLSVTIRSSKTPTDTTTQRKDGRSVRTTINWVLLFQMLSLRENLNCNPDDKVIVFMLCLIYACHLVNHLTNPYFTLAEFCIKLPWCFLSIFCSVGRYAVVNGNPYCNAHHKQVLNLQCPSMTNVNILRDTGNKTDSDASDTPAPLESTPTDVIYEKRIQGSDRNPRSLSKTRCFECDELTKPGSSLILLDRVYHLECLKCKVCRKQLSRWNCKELDGLLYCSRDYAELLVNRAKASVRMGFETNQADQPLTI